MIRNDTVVAMVDFKSAEEESESSILKRRGRSRSCLFQKSGVGVGVDVDSFQIEAGSR